MGSAIIDFQTLRVPRALLIVPCYNEASRISPEQFHAFVSAGNYICFADDGSKDGTSDLLRKYFEGHPLVTVFRSETNLGKAGIIRAAALDLLKKGMPKEIEWVGFWDADLATPLGEVELFLRFQRDFAPQAQAIFGSRVLRLGAEIERSVLRHYLGRAFATLAALMLKVRSYDSQCGAKLFHRSILEKIFQEEFISRWIFDLEILLRIGEKQVVEFPVNQWHDVPGSKVKIFKEIFRVLLDMKKIRDRYC